MYDAPEAEARGGEPPQASREIETALGLPTAPATARRRYGLATLAVVLVAGGAWLLWGIGGGAARTQYTTEPVTRGPLTVAITATGYIQPTNQVDVSSELSGTVREVLVDYNSAVTVGQVLARLDTDKLIAAIENSRARLIAARARVQQALATIEETRADYERKSQLSARQVISEQDLALAKAAYERARAAHASAAAEVDVVAADLRVNQTNLSKATIRSPIRGTVLARNLNPGQTVASALQAPVLFVIAEDLRQMELQVDVDEADVGQVQVGQAATFRVDAYPERGFPAAIRELRYGSEVVQGVVSYKAVLSIDNAELLLRPGMTATAEIVVRQVADALLVSNAALRFAPAAAELEPASRPLLQRLFPRPPRSASTNAKRDDGPARTVWILHEGVPVEVPVVAGATDGRRTEIREGELRAGQAVIVNASTAR